MSEEAFGAGFAITYPRETYVSVEGFIPEVFGGPAWLWTVRCTPPTPFYCIFKKQFLEIFEMWTVRWPIFFWKFAEISKNFRKFSSILVHFRFKIVSNWYISRNLIKFTPKSPVLETKNEHWKKLKIFQKFEKFLTPTPPKNHFLFDF